MRRIKYLDSLTHFRAAPKNLYKSILLPADVSKIPCASSKCVDPGLLHLTRVYTVCSGLSVQILRINTVF